MSACREGGDIIAVAAGVKVLVATKTVDSARARMALWLWSVRRVGHDPFSEMIFIFRSKRADRLETAGVGRFGASFVLETLEHRAFRWPPVSDGVMRLTARDLRHWLTGWIGRVCTPGCCAADGVLVRAANY